MNKQDWLDYFEAINGRAATHEEINKALLSGEFTDSSANTSEIKFDSNHQTTQEQFTSQANQGNAHFQNSFTQQGHGANPNSQVYNVQVAVPSSFSIYLNKLWQWLTSSWKNPTSYILSEGKWNGLTSLGLQVFFATLTIFYTLKGIGRIFSGFLSNFLPSELTSELYSYTYPGVPSMGFQMFFRLFVVVAFLLFSVIFSAYIVKRFVYRDTNFTFKFTIDWFGRLYAINIILFAMSFILSILGIYTLVVFLFNVAMLIIPIGSLYTLSLLTNNFKMDKFYIFSLGILVNAIITFIFFSTGLSMVAQMFVSSVF
ncbi:DUF6574 domain-containing protein [Streptococcus fryi]